MAKLQSQGVRHITLVGADRQTSVDFWQGVLGMPPGFEQLALDLPDPYHLYFDPAAGGGSPPTPTCCARPTTSALPEVPTT
jgi:glyoxalase family protein